MKTNETRRYKPEKSETLPALFFITPSFLGFVVFFLFPVASSLVLSFAKWDLAGSLSNMEFVGLDNYRKILSEVWFVDSMKNSLFFTVITVAVGVSLSLVLASVISRLAFFKKTIKAVFFLPYISSVVAVSIVWKIILQPTYGPVNQFLRAVGIENPPNWLVDLKWALPAIIIMYIWQNLGYNIVVYMAGIASINSELYEAAEVDGASGMRKFFSITVPMISPTTFFLVIMGIINSFKVFDQVQVLTQGGPGSSTSVLALYIYREAFRFHRMGYASAAAWVMFVIIFIVTIIQWRGQRKWVTYE